MWEPPSIKPGSIVYHYTSPDGLVGIFTNRALWASSASSLNDASELERGRKKVRQRLRAELTSTPGDAAITHTLALTRKSTLYVPHRSEVFILCASREGDDAAQWRLYCGARGGFTLHIDTSKRLQVVAPKGQPTTVPGSFGDWYRGTTVERWYRVAYTRTQRKRLLDSLIAYVRKRYSQGSAELASADDALRQGELISLNADIAAAAQLAAALIKPRGFRAECEVRAVVRVVDADALVSYRANGEVPIRYLRLAVEPGSHPMVSTAMLDEPDANTGRPNRDLPIVAVTIGPSAQFTDVEQTVRSLAANAGLRGMPIDRSRVPLRWS